MEQMTGSKLGKEKVKSVYCHPAYLSSIMQKAGLDEAQTGIKIARRNINNLTYVDDTTLMAESESELRSLLMKVKKKNEKAGLKLNIEKLRPGYPVPSLVANRREKSGSSDRLWVPKSLQMVTAAMKLKDACSLEKISYDKPRQCIKKQKHHFAEEGLSSQSYGFSSSHVQYYSGP